MNSTITKNINNTKNENILWIEKKDKKFMAQNKSFSVSSLDEVLAEQQNIKVDIIIDKINKDNSSSGEGRI